MDGWSRSTRTHTHTPSLLLSHALTVPPLAPPSSLPLCDVHAHDDNDNAVAEQQAQAATELATASKEDLQATQSELASVKAELAAGRAKVHELSTEVAHLKQANLRLSKAQQRTEELQAALAEATTAAAAAEAEAKEKISKVGLLACARVEEDRQTQAAGTQRV